MIVPIDEIGSSIITIAKVAAKTMITEQRERGRHGNKGD